MRHFTEDIRLQKCQKKKNAVALHTTLNQYSRILNWCRLRYQSCARRVSNMNTERASTKHTIHWHRSQLQIQKNRKLFSVSAKRKQCLLAFPKSFSSQSLQKHCRKSKRGGRKKKKKGRVDIRKPLGSTPFSKALAGAMRERNSHQTKWHLLETVHLQPAFFNPLPHTQTTEHSELCTVSTASLSDIA